jgi:hypothetical protein
MNHNITITSRKHGKKEPQSFFHCGSFDHPDMQSLKNFRLVFMVGNSIIWGHVIYRWKGLENTFPMVYYVPPESQNCSHKTKKSNPQS